MMDQLTADLKRAKTSEEQAVAGIQARARLMNLLCEKLSGYFIYLDKSSEPILNEIFGQF